MKKSKSFSNIITQKNMWFLLGLEKTFLVYTMKYFYDFFKCKSFISRFKSVRRFITHILIPCSFFFFLQPFQKKILTVIDHLEMHSRVNYNSTVIQKSFWIELNQTGIYLPPRMNTYPDTVSNILYSLRVH